MLTTWPAICCQTQLKPFKPRFPLCFQLGLRSKTTNYRVPLATGCNTASWILAYIWSTLLSLQLHSSTPQNQFTLWSLCSKPEVSLTLYEALLNEPLSSIGRCTRGSSQMAWRLRKWLTLWQFWHLTWTISDYLTTRQTLRRGLCSIVGRGDGAALCQQPLLVSVWLMVLHSRHENSRPVSPSDCKDSMLHTWNVTCRRKTCFFLTDSESLQPSW